MPELLNIKSWGGQRLIITDTHIIVQGGPRMYAGIMPRATFSSLTSQGQLWRRRLFFTGAGGNRIVALSVKSADAQRVEAILSGRD